jgi:hypothetical protein
MLAGLRPLRFFEHGRDSIGDDNMVCDAQLARAVAPLAATAEAM